MDASSLAREDGRKSAMQQRVTQLLNGDRLDKRRAVETLLKDAEWSKWSNHEVARRCAVSAEFVRQMRESLTTVASEYPTERTYTDRYGNTRTMRTENIGRRRTQQRGSQPGKGAALPAHAGAVRRAYAGIIAARRETRKPQALAIPLAVPPPVAGGDQRRAQERRRQEPLAEVEESMHRPS